MSAAAAVRSARGDRAQLLTARLGVSAESIFGQLIENLVIF